MNSKEPHYTETRIVAKVGIIRSLPGFACKPTKEAIPEGPARRVLPIGLGHTFELVLFLYMQNKMIGSTILGNKNKMEVTNLDGVRV